MGFQIRWNVNMGTNDFVSAQADDFVSAQADDFFFFFFLFFLKKFLEDMSPFCGATDTPVLDFWWRLPWVSKPGWIPCLRALSPVCHEFLRFTSGVTPADCIEVSMAAGCIPYMPCSRGRLPGWWLLVYEIKTAEMCNYLVFVNLCQSQCFTILHHILK